MKRICLRIESWRGWSIGAQHWYGKLRDYDGKDDSLPVDVTRKLDRAEAKFLCEKDGAPRGPLAPYKEGDECNRFDDEEALRESAIEQAKKLFGDEIEIRRGDRWDDWERMEKIHG